MELTLISSGYYYNNFRRPNVVVEWLTILLCIPEVPVSNLGSETGYHD
jgi:hypothetical protein